MSSPPLPPSPMCLLERHLLDPEQLPVHQGEDVGLFWEPQPEPRRLLRAELAPLETTLKVERDLATGERDRT